MKQTAAVVTVFAGSKNIWKKQVKNTYQPGLWPDVSTAHPGC